MYTRILLCNENFDPQAFLVAIDNADIVGFCVGIKRKYHYLDYGLQEDKAWLLAIGVLPEYRRQKIGQSLLIALENYYQGNTTHMVVGSFSPLYFFAAVEENSAAHNFFIKHDYKNDDKAYAMHLDLTTYEMPDAISDKEAELKNNDIEVRNFIYEDTIALLKMIKNNFSVGWFVNVQKAIANDKATKDIIIALKNKSPIGYIQKGYDLDESRIGPFGVIDSYRNAGVGTVLFHRCMTLMKKEGLARSYFKTTDEIALRFYLRNNMVIDKVMWHMSKKF